MNQFIWNGHSGSAHRFLSTNTLSFCSDRHKKRWEIKKGLPVLCWLDSSSSNSDRESQRRLTNANLVVLLQQTHGKFVKQTFPAPADNHFWVAIILALALLINLDLRSAGEQVSQELVAADEGFKWELVDQSRKKNKKNTKTKFLCQRRLPELFVCPPARNWALSQPNIDWGLDVGFASGPRHVTDELHFRMQPLVPKATIYYSPCPL